MVWKIVIPSESIADLIRIKLYHVTPYKNVIFIDSVHHGTVIGVIVIIHVFSLSAIPYFAHAYIPELVND